MSEKEERKETLSKKEELTPPEKPALEETPKPSSKPQAQPAPKGAMKPPQKLKGVRVKLLFRHGGQGLARRAKSRLTRAGAKVTEEKGSEGGTWEPFWGHVYYFGADMEDEAKDAVQMLSSLGYLETKGPSKGDAFDLVIWLQAEVP